PPDHSVSERAIHQAKHRSEHRPFASLILRSAPRNLHHSHDSRERTTALRKPGPLFDQARFSLTPFRPATATQITRPTTRLHGYGLAGDFDFRCSKLEINKRYRTGGRKKF